MITSFFPGRIRLRAEVFKDEELCKKAQKILSSSDAVKNIQHNIRTGSILLEYDVEKVPMESLLKMQNFFEELALQAEQYSEENRDVISNLLDELSEKIKEISKK